MITEDFHTQAWKRFLADMAARLDDLRRLNDAPRAEIETALIRGQIKEVKRILALSPSASPEAGDE